MPLVILLKFCSRSDGTSATSGGQIREGNGALQMVTTIAADDHSYGVIRSGKSASGDGFGLLRGQLPIGTEMKCYLDVGV
jgi:hypothetical protein